MTYLLDTNAISDLMRAAPGIETWMAGLDQGEHVVTCTVVRVEILFGLGRQVHEQSTLRPPPAGLASWLKFALKSFRHS